MKYFVLEFAWAHDPDDESRREVFVDESALQAFEQAERCGQLEIIDYTELQRYKSARDHDK